MGSMDGKTAIVTGASRSIGAAIATRFLEEGARVVLACRAEPPHSSDGRWGRSRRVARLEHLKFERCRGALRRGAGNVRGPA